MLVKSMLAPTVETTIVDNPVGEQESSFDKGASHVTKLILETAIEYPFLLEWMAMDSLVFGALV